MQPSLESGSLNTLAAVHSFEPLQVVFPEEEDHRQTDSRACQSDSELFSKEDSLDFQLFFRDSAKIDPDPEPWREWYPDDGIEPDDHLQRWGGPKGLTTALIRNNDQGRIIFERGCARGSSPPAPRRSLRLARRRRLPSPSRSEISLESEDQWRF
ncbi:unnamed protein product [Cuscuta campestris]|uniref:Uncharacterized protein n=1 Tax=Cuscuta campestris TaxID=132261 RepID=A0A484KVF7_9ASTE|nr:unnamed protein product [Cuscuta campestris]